MKLVDLLWPQIKVHRGCWYWIGNYDEVTLRPRLVTGQLVHRDLFAEHHGFPRQQLTGDELHHKCFNKFCVNPKHMNQVTPKEHERIDHNTPKAIAKRDYTWEYVRKHNLAVHRMHFAKPSWPSNIR